MHDRTVCYSCAGKGELVFTDEDEDLEDTDFEQDDWSRQHD